MKRLKTLFVVIFCCFGLRLEAQKNVHELSDSESQMNYVFSRIYNEKPIFKSLFNSSLYISIFRYSDSKINNESLNSETEEFYDSYLISISPDGDYYTKSKLFKIKKLFNPKILEIKEEKYPNFKVKIESGLSNHRKVTSYQLKGL